MWQVRVRVWVGGWGGRVSRVHLSSFMSNLCARSGLSNPYCQLSLGEHVQESKKNEDTSHPAGPADPVWNQVKHTAHCHLAGADGRG